MRKNGFTLLELLVVIVIIGILATLVVGGANYALRVSRAKRVSLSCSTLKTAIVRYHTEYGEWPGGKNPSSTGKVEYSGASNADVFGALRADNATDNPDGFTFIDETAFFTPDDDAGAVKLSETTGKMPLVYVSRSGRWIKKNGGYLYYTVEINCEFETVSVSAPEFDDEDED